MTAILAATVLAAILVIAIAPDVTAARRAVTISRSTFKSHRESVRIGARVGRRQMVAGVAVLVAVAALIGGAR